MNLRRSAYIAELRLDEPSSPSRDAEQELQKSERSIVARFALSLESPSSLVGYALTTERYGFPAHYWDKYTAQAMAVTAADIQRVARKYLNPDALQVVAVGGRLHRQASVGEVGRRVSLRR